MDLPERQEFRLEMPGLPELSGMVHAFLGRVIAFADIEGEDGKGVCDATCEALCLVEKTLESRRDVGLPIKLSVVVDAEAIEISILEQGIPLGDDSTAEGDARQLELAMRVFDDVRWEQRGSRGSELHLRLKRSHPEVTVLSDVEHRIAEQYLEEAEHTSEPSGDAEYVIRDFKSGDALEVSRRIYESYGRSYPNPDVFYPDRITALNRNGRLRSLIAEAPDGSVVAHYAIERPFLQPIGEAGVAVIDPPHRGRGLLKTMRKTLVEVAGSMELLGLWGQPTTRHPFSQRMNISFGSTPCGLSLGTTPASTVLRGGDGGDQGLRSSCFLYWQPLLEEGPIMASVPEGAASLVEAIYEARGRPATIETACPDPPVPVEHAGIAVRTRFDRVRKSGWIELDDIDFSTYGLVCEAMLMLIDIAGAEVVYVDLPITDPGCARLASALNEDGMFFAGIGPRFLGEDSLRLQRPVAPVDLDGLQVEGELGGRIAEHVLSSVDA